MLNRAVLHFVSFQVVVLMKLSQVYVRHQSAQPSQIEARSSCLPFWHAAFRVLDNDTVTLLFQSERCTIH